MTEETSSGFVKTLKFTWTLSKEDLVRWRSCLSSFKPIESEPFQLENDTFWTLIVYPTHEDSGKTALYLRWMSELNASNGFAECYVHCRLRHVESETTHSFSDSFNHTHTTFGFGQFMALPRSVPMSFTVELSIVFLYIGFKFSDSKAKKSDVSEETRQTAAVSRKSQSFDRWLSAIPYPQYKDTLLSEGYDAMAAMRTLDDAELQRIGVALTGHRRALLSYIADSSELTPFVSKSSLMPVSSLSSASSSSASSSPKRAASKRKLSEVLSTDTTSVSSAAIAAIDSVDSVTTAPKTVNVYLYNSFEKTFLEIVGDSMPIADAKALCRQMFETFNGQISLAINDILD